MSKHSYDKGCTCARCARETARRAAQAAATPRRTFLAPKRRLRQVDRRPVWGSQEWAETRGDDLGESNDR